MQISGIDFAIIGAYVLMMLGVGYYVMRRSPSFEDFLIAGRTMTTPILICTLASTYYGLDVLFGTSEIGFNDLGGGELVGEEPSIPRPRMLPVLLFSLDAR